MAIKCHTRPKTTKYNIGDRGSENYMSIKHCLNADQGLTGDVDEHAYPNILIHHHQHC